jgi:hypothetical protein
MKSTNDIASVEKYFRQVLLECLQSVDENAHVLRGFDKQKKGRKEKAVYFHMLNPAPTGGAGRGQTLEKGAQAYVQGFSIECYLNIVAKEDPVMFAQKVHLILQTLNFIEGLREHGIAPLNPSNIRTIYVQNEHNNYEMECSITVPLIFDYKIAPAVEPLDAADLRLKGV